MKTSQAKPGSVRPSPLSVNELGLAQRSRSIFARHTDKRGRLAFQILEGKEKESVVVPAGAALISGGIALSTNWQSKPKG